MTFVFKCISLLKSVKLKIIGLSIRDESINYFKSLLINISLFGLKKGLKLPILIFHNTNIYKIGTIHIKCPIKKGIIKIGHHDFKSQGRTKFYNNGVINVYGPLRIEGCCIIENNGTINFMGYNFISDGTSVLIRNQLTIGEHSRIGFHSFVMDSDDHFTIDCNTHLISRNTKPITIGKYNWIGHTTFIKKGTKTPDYFIVSSPNALLLKDYSEMPPYTVVGGSPIKIIKSGIRRIYNCETEEKIFNYFNTHPDINNIEAELNNQTLDEYCKNNNSF
ncbi:hypothetical protein [Prevotella sp. P2-180]|uniref:acyltransferase n=1 Tax=Prevotella sp. P2-180 TaxID=2024224 RepID=UPI000B96A23E|nr:hypothetical protein [Prevotella sp. P2-180]OYP62589.1 hypothetical protein CIK98_13480 [Prevotella sp. P2-180]